MRIFYALAICSIMVFSACKRDGRVEPDETIEAPVLQERSDKLPFACDMVTKDEMLSIVGMDVDMEVLDGNRNRPSDHATSCFYRWYDEKYDVSGVMIQINRNPLPDEIPNFVQKSMDNKRYNGERGYDDPNDLFKYSDFEGLDFPAIYSRDTYKYYFGLDNTFLCSVVFNYPAPHEKLDIWFKEIALKIKKRA